MFGTGEGEFGQRYGQLGQQLQTDFGLVQGADGFQIDPSNLYSRAAALQRSYEQGQRGTSVGLAGRGQLYSGAMQNALEHGTRQYGEAQHGLQTAYTRSLGEIDQQRLDRLSSAEAPVRDARAQQADFYANNPSAGPQPAVAPTYHPVVQQTMDRARRLWGQGQRKGRAWGDIISILGYDPRSGGGVTFR